MAINRNDTTTLQSTENIDFDLDFDDDDDDEEEEGGDGWLASYSDMMTDLMAIFVILFSFAMMNQAQQATIAKDAKEALQETQAAEGELDGSSGTGVYHLESEFDEIYELIKKKINESGYSDSIQLEKSEGAITFRFKDNVLFYPDSPVMRESSYDILNYMGDLLYSVNAGIDGMEISGFTARVSEDSKTNFFSWELSTGRAQSVLEFFVKNCDLPQSKMVVSGYSHHRPIASNDTEEGRSLNRRVEVKIIRTKVTDDILIERPADSKKDENKAEK